MLAHRGFLGFLLSAGHGILAWRPLWKPGTYDVFADRLVDPHNEEPQETLQYKYLTEKTYKFLVNGSALPNINFNPGESYAGRMPIGSSNPGGDLFFWFWPATGNEKTNEIIIWLNGGPGCSSLIGLLQENGPFVWAPGSISPKLNPWSWNRLANVVWIDQPVGTGFATGSATATDEEAVAEQFVGFWRNFVHAFGLLNYSVYLAGESYAGMYCPYIAAAMIDLEDQAFFDVKGMMIYDGVIGRDFLSQDVVAEPFFMYWRGLFPFNDTFRDNLRRDADRCGYTEFLAQYLKYPPEGPLPTKLPGLDSSQANILPECDILSRGYDEAQWLNPCLDIYNVAHTCPSLWDPLGNNPETETYFNRKDVKRAIHMPEDFRWDVCSQKPVFAGDTDRSEPSAFYAIPKVLEHTNNVVIAHGAQDMILLANGTLLSIQNMTWNGKMGFERKPVEPFFVPYFDGQRLPGPPVKDFLGGSGVMGTSHTERGLTYVGVNYAGHMVPQFAPAAAYRQVEFMLGKVRSLEGNEPFTFQPAYPQPEMANFGQGTAPA